MSYDVRLETVPVPRPLAVVRRRAALRQLPKVVPDACGVVWGVVRARPIPGAGRHVALYLGGATDGEIDLEVGVELEAPLAADAARDGEVVGSALPAGTTAVVTHFGPYGRLHEAHEAVRDWCARNGHAPAGPNWELYGHWVDAWNRSPELIRTDVYYLLAAGGRSAG